MYTLNKDELKKAVMKYLGIEGSENVEIDFIDNNGIKLNAVKKITLNVKEKENQHDIWRYNNLWRNGRLI